MYVAETTTKPSLVPLQKRSLGGGTVCPRRTAIGREHRFAARYLVVIVVGLLDYVVLI